MRGHVGVIGPGRLGHNRDPYMSMSNIETSNNCIESVSWMRINELLKGKSSM